MQTLLEFISQPWHWSVSGIIIVLVMYLLMYSGGRFGVSSNLRTICAMGGAEKLSDYFKFDWKGQMWNIVFILGAVLGGFIASQFLQSPDPVSVSQRTTEFLANLNIATPETLDQGAGFVPAELFGNLRKPLNLILLIIGGFLIGFGTRYAGGCTSGHAISGLANLQWTSLVAVVGFFIGGLTMTWLILPLVL